ncbi:MAG TPA: hypothetical protein VHC48_21620 [Puia sp.]|jgi:hypothetical protein|nr:hypothetical protein [Puia sp.]
MHRPAMHSTMIYLLSFFAGAAFFGFAGRLFPNEALNILPFLVFLSPLPILFVFYKTIKSSGTRADCPVSELRYTLQGKTL